MRHLSAVQVVAVLALLSCAPGALAQEAPAPAPVAAVVIDSTAPAVPCVDSTAQVAAPAFESTAPVAAPVASTEVSVTLDNVASLLERGAAPRLRVFNRYGRTVTGTAVSLKGGRLALDVSNEGVGIGGVLTTSVRDIVSMVAIVPMTPLERETAENATNMYLQQVRAGAAATPISPLLPPPGQPTGQPLQPETWVDPANQPPVPVTPPGLLAAYPPSEGWGPKRVQEITWKTVVLHVPPSEIEGAFLQNYTLWQTEYNAARAGQLAEMERIAGQGLPVPENFVVLPPLEEVPLEMQTPSPGPSQPVGNPSEQTPVGAPSPAPSAPVGTAK